MLPSVSGGLRAWASVLGRNDLVEIFIFARGVSHCTDRLAFAQETRILEMGVSLGNCTALVVVNRDIA